MNQNRADSTHARVPTTAATKLQLSPVAGHLVGWVKITAANTSQMTDMMLTGRLHLQSVHARLICLRVRREESGGVRRAGRMGASGQAHGQS